MTALAAVQATPPHAQRVSRSRRYRVLREVRNERWVDVTRYPRRGEVFLGRDGQFYRARRDLRPYGMTYPIAVEVR